MNIIIFTCYIIVNLLLIVSPLYSISIDAKELLQSVSPEASELVDSLKGLILKQSNFGEFAKSAVSAISPQLEGIVSDFENLFKGPENPVMDTLSKIKSAAYQVGTSQESVIYQGIAFRESSIEVLKDYRDDLKKIVALIDSSTSNFDFEKIRLLFIEIIDLSLKQRSQSNLAIIILDYILSCIELLKYEALLYKESSEKLTIFNNKMNDDLLKINLFLKTDNLMN